MGQEGKRWRGNLDVGSCLSGPGAVVGIEDHYKYLRPQKVEQLVTSTPFVRM